MNDSAIVTLCFGEEVLGDYLIPIDITVEELNRRLLPVLVNDHRKRFSGWNSLILSHDNYMLSDVNATLSDYGINTGCILRVIRAN